MTTDNSTGHDPDARAAAVEMLKAGEADVSDVARLAGVDRRVVDYWAKVAKVDVAKQRNSKQATQWRGHLAAVKGTAKPKRTRADEVKAVAALNKRRKR